MNVIIKPQKPYNGTYTVPSDKSITHRAVMFNSFSAGQAIITNALMSEDILSTISCMTGLGAKIQCEGNVIKVKGTKKFKKSSVLNAGNSGTTMRLLSGLVCGLGITATLDGDESLRHRPMDRVITPLSLMGAKISCDNGLAPLKIKPSVLKGIDYVMPVDSAQVKSAIILAALSAQGKTTITERVRSRDHTERLLQAMSADISVKGNVISVGQSELKSVDVTVPGDISSAAFLMVLATVLKGSNVLIKNVGVNPSRTGIIDVINASGGKISLLKRRTVCGEPVADLLVESAEIEGFNICSDQIPRLIDELPILCVLAVFARGESIIQGASELKVKESDRITVMAELLSKMGANIKATDDGMIIKGTGVLLGAKQKKLVKINPHNDHRMAMSLAVAGALSLDGVEITNAECADISYPDFYKLFS